MVARRAVISLLVLVGFAAGFGLSRGCAAQNEGSVSMKQVFTSPLAGRWYPESAPELSASIDRYLAAASPEAVEGPICALVLPHAGYRYSGGVAAWGVKLLRGRRFRRVFVLGPAHRVRLRNAVSLPAVSHYRTPLGEIPLARDVIDDLLAHPEFRTVPEAHEGEHSVQIELPLLQRVLDDFALVPVVVGELDGDAAARVAAVLAGVLGPESLVVISTDFTHYGRRFGYVPFRENVSDGIREGDMQAFELLQAREAVRLATYCNESGITICGRYALTVLAHLLPASSEVRLLRYDSSGAQLNDYTNSVSYLSAVCLGPWPDGKPVVPRPRVTLAETEQAALLRLARACLTAAVSGESAPTAAAAGIEVTPGMRQTMGGFVTLHKGEALRGCIGEIAPTRRLVDVVRERAVSAGLEDPRFPPVQPEELAALRIEISALTPPRPVASARDIRLGVHGIVLRKHGRSAVFLPQVASEQGWDLPTTLRYLSRKAGLPADAWREGASFTVFEAIVFAEPKEADRQ